MRAHDWFPRSRRLTREVRVGEVGIGGSHPVRVQSMLTCDTMDTATCIQQTLDLVEVGCEIVRITAPTVHDAKNLEQIRDGLRARGCQVPLVADIHFKPEAALEAARWVEKVRINPGNYADSKKFAIREYTDSQYLDELDRIRERFTPLVLFCKDHGVALRIGTNHGSLSDRIMNRYGDTPLGMVESALEFARIARDLDYHNFLFSMKASNPKVMIAAYRLLVDRLEELGPDWNYPLHLGVTEAGDGEDGRIKSAIGIGSLLADGLGDTIRVSLTEDSVYEIPVAKGLIRIAPELAFFNVKNTSNSVESSYLPNPHSYNRRDSAAIPLAGKSAGGNGVVRVLTTRSRHASVAHKLSGLGDFAPEGILEEAGILAVDPRDGTALREVNARRESVWVTVADDCGLPVIGAFRMLAGALEPRHPILLKDALGGERGVSPEETLLRSAAVIGSLLCDGIGDAIVIRGESRAGASLRLAFNILQGAGVRIFKTDYVACPSCGRTLFNLQKTTARIRAATSHLKGLKIGIMGCIVNGPGEMADADFGYVGGAPGKVNLYVGKKAVKFNIPEEEAVDRLVDLIREHGRWVDPPPAGE